MYYVKNCIIWVNIMVFNQTSINKIINSMSSTIYIKIFTQRLGIEPWRRYLYIWHSTKKRSSLKVTGIWVYTQRLIASAYMSFMRYIISSSMKDDNQTYLEFPQSINTVRGFNWATMITDKLEQWVIISLSRSKDHQIVNA